MTPSTVVAASAANVVWDFFSMAGWEDGRPGDWLRTGGESRNQYPGAGKTSPKVALASSPEPMVVALMAPETLRM